MALRVRLATPPAWEPPEEDSPQASHSHSRMPGWRQMRASDPSAEVQNPRVPHTAGGLLSWRGTALFCPPVLSAGRPEFSAWDLWAVRRCNSRSGHGVAARGRGSGQAAAPGRSNLWEYSSFLPLSGDPAGTPGRKGPLPGPRRSGVTRLWLGSVPHPCTPLLPSCALHSPVPACPPAK